MSDKTKRKKSLSHIIKEGDRNHVVYYDAKGRCCSEKDCEVNNKNLYRREAQLLKTKADELIVKGG